LEKADLDFGHTELLEASVESVDDFFSYLFVFFASLIPHINNNWESFLEVIASKNWHLL